MVKLGPGTGEIDLFPLKTMKQVGRRNGKPAWKCIAEGCRRPQEQLRVGFVSELSRNHTLSEKADRSICEFSMRLDTLTKNTVPRKLSRPSLTGTGALSASTI